MSDKRQVFCVCRERTYDRFICGCGWPKEACKVYWPQYHKTQLEPPEPGAIFDGETWRA